MVSLPHYCMRRGIESKCLNLDDNIVLLEFSSIRPLIQRKQY